MDKVRLGIVGVRGMGGGHARYVLDKRVNRCELTAVCDIVPQYMDKYPTLKKFADSRDLIRSGEVDAILIATPHYDHTTIGIDALQQGIHVLVEKPISVHKADCERLIAAHSDKKVVFAAMFNQRTSPVYTKVKKFVAKGELGEITRINWIISDWFRTETYYASGDWRATWEGEGGGVLVNQCPHQLDLLQWICGMPNRICGFCKLGARHNIEVEDEVTAYMEYPNGATGVFVTTTGEAPGTNRLEIAGEMGKLVIEHGKVTFTRNEIPMSEFRRTSKASFARPEVWHVEIPVVGQGGRHEQITQNFVDAILDGTPLLAPAEEGINSVEIANAMLLSSLTGRPVDLPMDGRVFEKKLKELIAGSRFKKTKRQVEEQDISVSFPKV